jgi:hypothetical protein
MATTTDDESVSAITGVHEIRGQPRAVTMLPTVPALPRDPSSSTEVDDPSPTALAPAEQLGFDLRFEAGRTLLALKDCAVDAGITIARALFEVPDVVYPLNVSNGPTQFRNRRLSLRAIELTLSHPSLYVPERLRDAGFTLLRQRGRAGGIELLVEMRGPQSAVPIRARGLFAPVGEAGCAIVLHEVISFSPTPLPRAHIAEQLLNALSLPGAHPARAMLRRADPFRAVLARLMPQYGWKVPAVGDVRVHEVVQGKNEITLRAWARDLPDGWGPRREQLRGPLEEAVALAVFADGLVEAGENGARLVDRLLDGVGGAKALVPSVVPFAAEILRADPRRRNEGHDVLRAALTAHPSHLGLLAALAEEDEIDGRERARRLQALGRSADHADEPWVAARAFMVGAQAALDDGGGAELALECAEAAFLADPSAAETGTLASRLLASAGDVSRALAVGRTALERTEDPLAAEAFAVGLAHMARKVEGPDSARVLLRRALRRTDRRDALTALIDVEIEAGALERAAELLTRLLVLVDKDGVPAVGPGPAGESETESRNEARADVEALAARLAEARGDRDAARMHLAKARELRPTDPTVMAHLARLVDEAGQPDRALDLLHEANAAPSAPTESLALAARLLVRRRGVGDAERARALIARVPPTEHTAAMARVDAEAQAVLGEHVPLARILVAEAGDTPADSRQLLEAAGMLIEAKQLEDAAAALARAFVHDSASVAGLLVQALSSELVRALGAHGRELSATALHGVANRLAGAGRPLDAHALLLALDDNASIELRVSFAKSAGDTALEIAERERLLESSAMLDIGELAPAFRRLAALHARPGGRGPGAAADAWQQAALGGTVDIAAWLDAALASDDGARLAAVLRRDDAEVANVPSAPLRRAVAALTGEADGAARLKLAGQLAARGELLEDTELYLAEARALPPQEAAHVLATAGARHGRADWLVEAADVLEVHGQGTAALKLLLDTMDSDPEVARAVHEKAFALAVASVGEGGAIERTAQALLLRTDLERHARLRVHAQRTAAVMKLDPAQAQAALGQWLDEDPASGRALALLVPLQLNDGEPARALERIEKACERLPQEDVGGERAAVLTLLQQTAHAAQKKGAVSVEIRARELLLTVGPSVTRARGREERRIALGAQPPPPGIVAAAPVKDDVSALLQRRAELERLADLYAEAGRMRDAIHALNTRVGLGGADAKLATLYLRIASLEEELKDTPAAARALEGRLRYAPDDASTSKHLVALLAELGDDVRLFKELVRRAARVNPSAERAELWLRAGDAALRLDRPTDARAIWWRALRATPYAPEILERLLTLGRTTKNHQLIVRARIAAAQTLADGAPAAEQAAEAGAYLYGFMSRPRLALVAFRFAAKTDRQPARHTRILVDIYRALNEGRPAIAALDELIDKAQDKDKAVLLELRAEILEDQLADKVSACDARRQALALDPTQRTAARALARALRAQGDARGAFDVDRAWADAALAPPARASAYAVLGARAEEELKDLPLCAELCAASLQLAHSVDVLRRHVRALVANRGEPEAVEAIGRLLEESLPLEERLALVLQKARLQSDVLGQKKHARQTLKAGLEDKTLAAHADADQIIDALARVEEDLDDPAAAAALLIDALGRYQIGTRTLGDRRTVLERSASLLDRAKERPGALELLQEAAALEVPSGGLSRGGELRRARLAEELGQHGIAVASLQRLLASVIGTDHGDEEERTALLGRLASAAEKKGDQEAALAAWLERTLRHVERSATALGRAPVARQAADALLRLSPEADGGDSEERCLRLLACARDSRDRLGDPAAGALLFARARAVRSDASLRKESLACAEAAGDARAALALFDEMARESDQLDASLLLRRAELRIREGGAMSAAFEDLMLAVDRGVLATPAGDATLIAELVELAARADASLVARALLQRAGDGHDTSLALRAALTPARLLPPSSKLDSDLVIGIADALPLDVELAIAAADRMKAAGRAAAAADRLWALADRLEPAERSAAEGSELRDRGAEALLSRPRAPSSEVLARLEALRPSLARRPDVRSLALVALRDAEAWHAVAVILEDAVACAPPTEARALRLELVSVLRTGVEDEARAAEHLQALVTADPDDREAWGELLECLDALGPAPAHRARLDEALAARAARATGIEKRELVRRRAQLLAELGRLPEALPQLIEVRAHSGGDPELKLLERRVHEGRGAQALAAFLTAELQRTASVAGAVAHAATGPSNDDAAARLEAAHRDATALLELDPDVVDVAARVFAHRVLAVDEAAARRGARAVLDAPAPLDRRIAEAVAVAEGLGADTPAGDDVLLRAFLLGLAEHAGVLGSVGALKLSDALCAQSIAGTAAAFGTASAMRRWRTEGARRAAVDIEALTKDARPGSDGDAERMAVALVALRRAWRMGDAPAARTAANALAGHPLGAQLLARPTVANDAAGLLDRKAALAIVAQARSVNAVVAAVRVGDAAGGTAALRRLSNDDRAASARRARHLKLTPERLALRIALAPSLPALEAAVELAAAAATAIGAERWQDAALALDGLVERGAADARLLAERAELAWRLHSPDAPRWSTRAADAIKAEADSTAPWTTLASTTAFTTTSGPSELDHRRKAVQGLLGAPASHGADGHAAARAAASSQRDELRSALLALARAAPGDTRVQAEAFDLAQAADLPDIVDALMADAPSDTIGGDVPAEERAALLRKRADHRLTAHRDAQGAYRILLQGAAGGDPSLREAAYQLAAAEGLVDEQLEVVDDDLARAGLLALCGKSALAMTLARSLDVPAGWLLVAEVAALEGDEASCAQALERLDVEHSMDPALLSLRIHHDRRRGALEDAARRAVDVIERFGASPERIALLLAVAAGATGAPKVAHLLRVALEAEPSLVPRHLQERALDVWEATARMADLPQDVRAARHRRCRLLDDDEAWLSFLLGDLPTASADEGALWLRPLLARSAILPRLIEAAPDGLAAALGLLVRSGDAAAVAEVLSTRAMDQSLSFALASALASALAVLGRAGEAARALLDARPETGTAGKRAVRAAGILLDAGDARGAVAALLRAPLDEMDEAFISMAREVSISAGDAGTPLLVRMALANGDIDGALSLAERASPDVALAVAGSTLSRSTPAARRAGSPHNERAWRLMATVGGGAAQQHFAVALALRGLMPWPASLVEDDAAFVRRLQERTLAVDVARRWAHGRRPRTPLQTARLGQDREARQSAWRDLAVGAGTRQDEIGVARLLARSGVAVGAAAIELRLAADPAIAEPAMRAAALALALCSPELATHAAPPANAARRASLVAAFDALDDKGFAGARLRTDVHGPRADLAGQIDGNDLGAAVDPVAVFRALGRRPGGEARATAGALLAAGGREDLALIVDPRVAAGPSMALTEGLEARAQGAALRRPLEAAGLLRLVSALKGYDVARERTIQDLAHQAGHIDLVAESLGRMAGAAMSTPDRATVLRQRALVLAGQPDDPAMMARARADARAAIALAPDDPQGVRLWLQLTENRLKVATDAAEVKALAREAARLAKDSLADLERAASLLYLAHRADAEDAEVRLELTEIYAQVPHLAAHAVTGILQLLRRTPTDPRVFALAASLGDRQQTPERAAAMRTAEGLLRGRGPGADVRPILDELPGIRALDAETIQVRLAPTGWGAPLHQLISFLGPALETALQEPALPSGLVGLNEKSPRGALAIERLERALPGRAIRVLCGSTDRLRVLPGPVPTVVIPEDAVDLGDAALLAIVARAYGIVRLGAVLPEITAPGDEPGIIDLLRMAFIGEQRDARATKLLSRLTEHQGAAARELALRVFAGPVDMSGTLNLLSRAADRLALVVSGSLAGTLHAGALPTLLREPPERAASLLTASPRALELAAFAARDNAWLVRRQHGFVRE